MLSSGKFIKKTKKNQHRFYKQIYFSSGISIEFVVEKLNLCKYGYRILSTWVVSSSFGLFVFGGEIS